MLNKTRLSQPNILCLSTKANKPGNASKSASVNMNLTLNSHRIRK